jgi:hypothetical protein
VIAELEPQVEGQAAHEVLGAAVGVRERPLDRALAQLAVVRIAVGAAAVFEVARNRVVVVAVDRRDRPLLDQVADLVRVRAVADEISAAPHAVDTELAYGLERRLEGGQIRVNIGDDRHSLHSVAQSKH